MKWKILIVAVLIIGAAAGYYFYNETIEQTAVKTYETTKVIRNDLIKTVSATGTVQPRDSVEVSGKVTARIKEILVEENDHVTAGQVVAILDGKDYEAKLDQANFTLTNARQKLFIKSARSLWRNCRTLNTNTTGRNLPLNLPKTTLIKPS